MIWITDTSLLVSSLSHLGKVFIIFAFAKIWSYSSVGSEDLVLDYWLQIRLDSCKSNLAHHPLHKDDNAMTCSDQKSPLS